MAIETAESAFTLISVAEDKVCPVVSEEIGNNNRRPIEMNMMADSVDANKKLVMNFAGCYIGGVDSSEGSGISKAPTMTWEER